MELWDLYDIDRVPLGRTAVRGVTKLQKGEYHLVVHIGVFNARGEMLIQKRHREKQLWPGLWDISAGGSGIAGENSRSAAHRELLEEIGIDKDFTGIRPRFTVYFDVGFDDFYCVQEDIPDLSVLRLQEEEVEQVRWAAREEVLRMSRNGEFVNYRACVIETLFDMARHPGTLRR